MKTLFKSFYAKASGIFLGLMLVLVLLVSWLCVQAAVQYEVETDQTLNKTLASHLAEKFQPWVIEKIDDKMLKMEIDKLMGVNRRIEIYLLGGNGMIKAHYLPEDGDLSLTTVSTEPLDALMNGADLPVLGDDPLQAGRQKPFSVAPINIMGEEGCYLYVILGGEYYDSVGALIQDSYIFRLAGMGISISVLVTGLLGLLLFGLLAGRLSRMRNVVQSFQNGHLDHRVKPRSSDEIAQLGHAFDDMADTIVSNMDKLKQADTQRRELIANISHDLRSPLASIQGYLETVLIKDEALSPEERRTYVETGLKNTKRLNNLVNALFELSKLDAGQINPQFEKLSIAELVQDVVMQFKPQAEKRGVELTANLDGPLPMVYADIGLVERAISNLIDNAIRHTPTGGRVSIVPTNDSAEKVMVAVADSGQGIPEEDLSRIFERFYRVEKSRTPNESSGSGLGLAIAKRIFELHGSALSVQSALNKGTTFRFTLPTSAEGLRLNVKELAGHGIGVG